LFALELEGAAQSLAGGARGDERRPDRPAVLGPEALGDHVDDRPLGEPAPVERHP
jgi:hypothetical protein